MKDTWSSKFSFILATTGAAVGLGSIWKFPYMAGMNGGGAFVLVVILSTIFVGAPIMMGEILLGRLGRQNPVSTMSLLAKQYHGSKYWQYLGWWGMLALVLVLSFYSVIAGWSIAYMLKTWSGQLTGLSTQAIHHHWVEFLGDPFELMLWHALFIVLTLFVVAKGVQRGLERASQIMMPGLFLVLLILMGYSAIVGDLHAALQFLFKPDFTQLTPRVLIDALGQATFSLATGAGCMLVYGCYVSKDTPIAKTVSVIVTLIILVSLLSGLAIFPLVFEYRLAPEGGPGLMFKVLPIVFNQMPFGHFFGGLFFLMLFFAGWTSSISMAEPMVVVLIQKFRISRIQASFIVGSITFALGLLALSSFNVYENVKILGKYDFFNAMADFATNIILPTGAFAFAIFSGWKVTANDAKAALHLPNFGFSIWKILIRFIAPLGIAIIFIL